MDRFRSIVVPTDFSPFSEAAIARAAALAELDGAAIHLVHALRFPLVVAPYEVSVPTAVWEGVRQASRQKIQKAREALEAKGLEEVTAEVADSGDAVEAIVKAIEAHAADLVVMGTHGFGGLKHAFLGSVTERTLRSVDRPVLAVKEDPQRAAEPIERILLAVDFSPESDRAVEMARDLAKRLPASVDIVHVLDLVPDYLQEAAAFGSDTEKRAQVQAADRLIEIRKRLQQSDVATATFCRTGRPSLVIAELAKEHGNQLIVMGTRGQSGLKHVLLGSVAERTLRGAPCAVLAVQADRDDSPS